MASLALHVDGVILLLQYLFIHRINIETCPHCATALHGDNDEDVFRRGYSGRVDQVRRSMIDTRSYVTATRTSESKDAESTYETEVDEGKSSSVADSMPPPPRPSMVQSEIPDPPILPRLTIRLEESVRTDTPISQWSNSQDPKAGISRIGSSPYRSLMRKSRDAMYIKPVMPQIPVPPLPMSQPFNPTSQAVFNGIPTSSFPFREPPPDSSATSSRKAETPSIRTLNSTSPAPAPSNTVSGAKRQSRTTLLWPVADSPRSSMRTARSVRNVAEQFEENVSRAGSQMKRTQSLRYYI